MRKKLTSRFRGPDAIPANRVLLFVAVPIFLLYIAARFSGLDALGILAFATLLTFFVVRERRASLLAHDRGAALVEAEETNRLLLMTEEMAGVGHWEFDLGTNRLFWSEQTCRIHGVEPGYTPPLDAALDAYHPDDRPRVAECVERAIASGEGYGFEARLIRADGEIRTVEATARVETDDDGTALSMFGVFRDRTDEIARERALTDALRDARHAVAAKGRFLANMSHEIRTPMNGVIGFTDLLLADETLSDTQRKHVKLISDSGRSMLELLGDILDISKIEAGSLELADEPVDVREKIQNSADILRASASAKGIAIDVVVDPAVPSFIAGDRLRVRQILLNLIGNAIKFTESGRIAVDASVRMTDQGRELQIEVADTGIGIAADKLDRIFDNFGQADATTARRFGGSGLGLAISRNLARLMGGDISATSRPGEGSVFAVRIPLREVSAPDRVCETAARTNVNFGPARLLIVEDNEVNQMLSEAMCEQLGLAHDIAVNGREAIAMIDRARAEGTLYDLVLMDLQMPEMDGFAATRALRDAGYDAATLPIVALTANAFADDIDACLEAGMQDHLTKPVTLQQLEAMVARYVDRPAEAPRQDLAG